jgi:hypothetical protein
MKNYWIQIFAKPQQTIRHLLDNHPTYAQSFLYFIYGLFFLATFTQSSYDQIIQGIYDGFGARISGFSLSYEACSLFGLILCWPFGVLVAHLAAWIYYGLAKLMKQPVDYKTTLIAVLWGGYVTMPVYVLTIILNFYYLNEWTLVLSLWSVLYYSLSIVSLFIFVLILKEALQLKASRIVSIGLVGIVLETIMAVLMNFFFMILMTLMMCCYALIFKS